MGQLRSDAPGEGHQGERGPVGGQIIRDTDGDPTGVFIDGAMGLVAPADPPPSKADVARRLLAAQDEA